MQPEFFVSTDMVEEKIRAEFWRDVSKIFYEVRNSEDQPADDLKGSVRSRLFGDMVVGDTTFNDQICNRTPEIIRATSLDLVLMQVVIEGDYFGDFDDTDVTARPGDIFFLDLAKTLKSRKHRGRRVAIAIPREELRTFLPVRNAHGLVLKGHSATNRLLFDYVVGIGRTLDLMRPDEIPAIQEAMMSLIRAAATGAQADVLRHPNAHTPLYQRIVEFICDNISDPALDPSAIMRRFSVSHSHLYRAFEAEGGVAKFIRNKRLDLAYHLLTTDRTGKLSLKHVRRTLGVADRSDFSAFFRERFGVSPLETRGTGAQNPHEEGTSIVLHKYLSAKASGLKPG